MTMKRATFVMCAAAVIVIVGLQGCAALRAAGANGLLHPAKNVLAEDANAALQQVSLQGEGIELSGWTLPAEGPARGTVIYLHGVADNRGSSLGALRRVSSLGFDALAYDSRAHGASGGDVCTYGFYEKEDLRRVIDRVRQGPIVVIGTSLGAAVALQAAAEDPRIAAVAAAESFSDLRTVATERAPWFFTAGMVRQSLALAETQGRFLVDDVSPVRAAQRIAVPVLVIHGALDRETRPDHSRRIFDALRGPKRLLIVEGAGHNGSLTSSTWKEIEVWLDSVTRPGGA